MKLKILRALAFCGLAVALFLLANYFYEKSDHYRGIEGLFRYENVPYDLQVVNFGSSHGQYGIDYSNFPRLRTFNFALASQTTYFDHLLMQTYQKHLARGCVVIMPISCHLLYRPIVNETILPLLPRYYRILDTKYMRDIPGFNLTDVLLYRYVPILSAQRAVTMTFAPRHDLSYIPPGDIMGPANAEAGRHRAHFHRMDLDDNKIMPEQVDGLKRMLDLCRQNGWRPVIVTTPVMEYYSKWFSAKAVTDFYNTLRSIIAEYPEAIYLDYSHDPRFARNAQLFYDTDHLNPQGRLAFTQILLQDCARAGLFSGSN